MPSAPGACGSFAGANAMGAGPSGLMIMPASSAYRFGPPPGVMGPLPQGAMSGSFGAGAPQMVPATNAATTYTMLQPTSRPPMASLISPIAAAPGVQALPAVAAASSAASLSSGALASPQASATPPSSKHPRHHSSNGASASSSTTQKSGTHHGGRRVQPAPAAFASSEDQKCWERDRQKKDNHNVSTLISLSLCSIPLALSLSLALSASASVLFPFPFPPLRLSRSLTSAGAPYRTLDLIRACYRCTPVRIARAARCIQFKRRRTPVGRCTVAYHQLAVAQRIDCCALHSS